MRQPALSLVLLVSFLTGCAMGQKHAYVNTDVEIPVKSSVELAVAVNDRRSYVVSGDKSPSFVGLQRGGFGNPFDINTESGEPLADDIRRTIVGALEREGNKVVAVPLSPATTPEVAKATLLQAEAKKFVLLTLYEWKSDQYANTLFHFNVSLDIFDPSGDAIETKRLSGKDNLGGGMSKSKMPAAFRQKLEDLFWSEEIRKAMR